MRWLACLLFLSLGVKAQTYDGWGAARWIGGGTVFHKEFKVEGKISSATLRITGLGYYAAALNGRKVGDHFLDPGWTDYRKRVPYNSFDVTGMLIPGDNKIDVELGNGWYNADSLLMWGRLNMRDYLATGQPRLIARLQIVFEGGKRMELVSDPGWQTGDGALVRNGNYTGCVYDMRRLAVDWRPAELVDEPGGTLVPMEQPPVRNEAFVKPVSIRLLRTGHYIVDMGRNFAGVIRLVAEGKSGDLVRIRYGELLYPDGSLNGMTSVAGQIKARGVGGPGAPDTAYQQDELILDGKGPTVFIPSFTFHGFRYVELVGYPGLLTADNIAGIPLHADVALSGDFQCSDSLFNAIQLMCSRTFLNNLFSVQSDCPHREKLGYGGDIVATSEAMMDNFDMHAFYKKVVHDFADDQQADGGMPETAPYVGIADGGQTRTSGPIGWGTAFPQLLDQLYTYYGDKELLAENYEKAKSWIHFIDVHAPDHIVAPGISDHESLETQETEISGTAFFYYNVKLLERMAGILKRSADQAQAAQLAETIRQTWLHRFYDSETGRVGKGTQMDQALGLYFKLAPAKALHILLDDLKDEHLHTGIFGTKFVMEVLSEHGYTDLAVKIAQQRSFPGWGYMLEHGATSLWEHWYFSDNTYSHDHPMFGSVTAWFYRYVAGIRPADDAVGYNKIIFQPGLASSLGSAATRYNTPHGVAAIEWRRDGKGLHVDVVVPEDTQGTVVLSSGSRVVGPGVYHFDVN